ncbi:MAG TPA: bifunctional shikimate kinase/3-dehydroquinate synthase [Gaiellaceae bacterium]|nr:bifunctional shikimate kinase/3-dehydroquinate synthase [Gaiellaceae bacterium]
MARVPGANQLKNVALVGFMGSGKSTAARAVGGIDVDDLVEASAGKSIPEIFRDEGEAAFRAREEEAAILALGGGAVTSPRVRDALEDTLTIWLDVDVDTCWERVRGSDRPLAQDEGEFRRLYAERRALYADVADVVAKDLDDVVLAAAGVIVERGALQRLGELVPGDGAVALISDPHVAGIHGMDAQLALGSRIAETHELPPGEEAKTLTAVDRLWQELRIDRTGTIVALGGGCTTDAAGFVAATYLRGVAWTPVPTSLVAQVDAAIGGKTAIDLPQGKNLVGAFYWPTRTVIDPALLETLPEPQRLEGLAEVVKAGLLAEEPFWELADDELVRRSLAFKAAICLRDPHERGERAILNFGHTFAHALEAAAGYEGLTHGRAVALGLLAALRLSGRDTDVVEEVLRPQPARVDRERAWQAMRRDKKARSGEIRLVLLGDDGPQHGVVLPAEDVRRELDRLIA